MEEFKIGDYIEVGFGESRYDEDGFSYFFRMDREGYNEYDIANIFDDVENVLYIEKVEDESAIIFAGESKFSDFLKAE